MSIRNIAREGSIERAVNFIPGCSFISITPQSSGKYLVKLTEFGGSRSITVEDSSHAMRILNRQEPETES